MQSPALRERHGMPAALRFAAGVNGFGDLAVGRIHEAQALGILVRDIQRFPVLGDRELFRVDNLCKPPGVRCAEPALYAEADVFHASPAFIDEATNIQMGTRYLQVLIDRARREHRVDPIAEAYMDYRGVRNGVYYRKIRAAADRLRRDADDIGALQAMTA